jgi:hypothetical protein
MKDDEIVSEVRRVRAEIFKECGGTLDGLYTRLKKSEKKHKARLVSPPPRRPNPAGQPQPVVRAIG